MNDFIHNATKMAYDDNVADMQQNIHQALYDKISDAIQSKRIEIAGSLLGVKEDLDESYSGTDWAGKANVHAKSAEKIANLYPRISDSTKRRALEREYAAHMFAHHEAMMINHTLAGRDSEARRESNLAKQHMDKAGLSSIRESMEELSEKLSPKMTAAEIIDDFVHSDDPKFDGKSKEERIKMALGAYYGMHPEKSVQSA